MKNTFKIVWANEAITNLNEIISYLDLRWTDKEINAFIISLKSLIKTIHQNPVAFPLSKNLKIRRAVLSKQTTLYYSLKKDTITIISLFDNRQNPDKKDY
jgi:plasmid stabilization system protein ParE